jgi:two-component system sensor histidine kinase HydH
MEHMAGSGDHADRWRRFADAMQKLHATEDVDGLITALVSELPRLTGQRRFTVMSHRDGVFRPLCSNRPTSSELAIELEDEHAVIRAAEEPVFVVPVHVKGRLAGVVLLEGPQPEEEELALVRAAVGQAAGALEARERAVALEDALRALRLDDDGRPGSVALGKIAFDITHELKNRLTSMSFALVNLRDALGSTPQPPELAETLGLLETDIHEMRDRLQTFYAIAHPRPARPGRCRVDLVVRTAVRRYAEQARAANVRLKVGAESTGWVLADETGLAAAVSNLVLNAFEALEGCKDGLVEVMVQDERDLIRTTVQDNGPGISPEHRDKVFEAFFTSKPRGMGLGLAQVFLFAEQNGGRSWLADTGRGACFVLDLPREQA